LRGYGQKDPRVEYEKEAYEIFEDLKGNIADEAIKAVFRVVVERQEETAAREAAEAAEAAALNGGINGTFMFEPVPDGALAPPPPPNGPSRLDPNYAEKLLGPVPGMPDQQELHTNHDGDEPKAPARASADKKVGRNDVCPCGSGKKYKRCHGVVA
jgi:preprotein translocase subunit SecA